MNATHFGFHTIPFIFLFLEFGTASCMKPLLYHLSYRTMGTVWRLIPFSVSQFIIYMFKPEDDSDMELKHVLYYFASLTIFLWLYALSSLSLFPLSACSRSVVIKASNNSSSAHNPGCFRIFFLCLSSLGGGIILTQGI